MKKIISWLIVVITVFSLLTTGVNCNADNRSKNYKYTIENTKTLDSVTYSLIKKSDISTNKTTTFWRFKNYKNNKYCKWYWQNSSKSNFKLWSSRKLLWFNSRKNQSAWNYNIYRFSRFWFNEKLKRNKIT